MTQQRYLIGDSNQPPPATLTTAIVSDNVMLDYKTMTTDDDDTKSLRLLFILFCDVNDHPHSI